MNISVGEVLKLGITVMVVAIVSAGILTFAHGVTAPVIEEQHIAEIEETLFEFFPDAEEVEIEEVDGKEFFVGYKDGELVGVVTTVTSSGYGGDIEMMVGVDSEGTIKGIEILAHEETPGLGDVIEREEWQEQFVGIDLETAPGAEVDMISGSTVSCNAAISGAEAGRDILAYEYLGFEEPVSDVDVTEVPDGTYEGVGAGFNDDIVVEVVVEGGEIIEIEILEHDDTPEYFEDGKQTVDDIIEAQSMEVDMETGATASSEGIAEAVINALVDEVE